MDYKSYYSKSAIHSNKNLRQNQSHSALRALDQSQLSHRASEIAKIYTKEEHNYIANKTVNQEPRDKTWSILRHKQKQFVLDKSIDENNTRLNCAT